MTTRKSALRRLVAGTGALTLGLAGAFAMGTNAFADVGPDQPDAPTTGTLTINKYKGAPVADGEDPAEVRDTLEGVEFTVTRVGRLVEGDLVPINLADRAHWDGLTELFDSAPAAPGGDFALTDTVQTGETLNGQATFTLDVGVYYVQETDPGDNNIVSPVPSFYVSIPSSEGTGGDGWNYDVVANPKNQVMEAPSKIIDEEQTGLVVGDTVTWELDIPIPTLNNNETFTEAIVTDVLDPRLSYVSSVVSIGAVELEVGTHYDVDTSAEWTLTQAGRALLDQYMGGTLSISVVTSVDSVGDGSIPNEEYSSTFNGTEVPGTVVPYTYWGQLSILKTDDSATPKPLEGAEFQVFALAANAECAVEAPEDGAIATGTSNQDGIVEWDDVDPIDVLGLWIADSNEGPLNDPSKDYCVYETVVPAGHTAVQIDNPVTITPGEDNVLALTVVNAKTDGPGLPVTGGAGTVGLMTGGILLLGIGASVMVMARRRQILEA